MEAGSHQTARSAARATARPQAPRSASEGNSAEERGADAPRTTNANPWLAAIDRGDVTQEEAAIADFHGLCVPPSATPYADMALCAMLEFEGLDGDCPVLALMQGAQPISFDAMRKLVGDAGAPGMGCDFRLTGQMNAVGDLWQARCDISRDGTRFTVGGPTGRLVLAVRDEDGFRCDAVALASADQREWSLLTGYADFLGEWELAACERGRADHLRLFATPMDWLRAGGEGACVLQWSSTAVARLRCLGERVTLRVDAGQAARLRSRMEYGGLPLVAEEVRDGARLSMAERLGRGLQ